MSFDIQNKNAFQNLRYYSLVKNKHIGPKMLCFQLGRPFLKTTLHGEGLGLGISDILHGRNHTRTILPSVSIPSQSIPPHWEC